jgi:hypothetical protein
MWHGILAREKLPKNRIRLCALVFFVVKLLP